MNWIQMIDTEVVRSGLALGTSFEDRAKGIC